MHVNESRGSAPSLERLEQLGLLSPLLAAVHMVKLDSADVDRIAAAGASVVHCPQSNLKLGSGLCPVPLFKEHGVNVAFGSGGVSNNDLLAELRSAALLASSMFPNATPVDPHEWLQTATLNGARALGLGESIGSLLPGKWADLCCIDLARPNTQPTYDPAAQIVFAAVARASHRRLGRRPHAGARPRADASRHRRRAEPRRAVARSASPRDE